MQVFFFQCADPEIGILYILTPGSPTTHICKKGLYRIYSLTRVVPMCDEYIQYRYRTVKWVVPMTRILYRVQCLLLSTQKSKYKSKVRP